MNPELGPGLGKIARAGSMTRVMRAVAPSYRPKVLRIGWVEAGRVVEERILGERATVTVGSHESNTFVVASPGAPRTFRLFERVGDDFRLTLGMGMSARIAGDGGVADVSPEGHAAESILLTPESRGKVIIGETVFLFQFIAPPPVQPRAQLPASLIRGSASVDWKTTLIAAVSFLAHFGAMGSVYSEWLDSVVDYDISVGGLLESLRVPPPPVVEEPTEQPIERTQETTTEKKGDSRAPTVRTTDNTPTSSPNTALSRSLEQIGMATVAALTSGDSATADVLRNGEVPTSALDDAAKRDVGVGTGFVFGAQAGPIRPGPNDNTLAALGSRTGASGPGIGGPVETRGPRGTTVMGPPSNIGSPIRNAASVVAGLRAGFRRCYEHALAASPDAEGRIALSIRVGPGGEVQGVTATTSGNLPQTVAACVRARAESAQFEPPAGGPALVQVPVTFVKQ